jgi:hypothetical protein
MSFADVVNSPFATILSIPTAEESWMHQPKPVRDGSMPSAIMLG